jgi:hypothetical protein
MTTATSELIRRVDVRTDLTQSREKMCQETIQDYADLYRDDVPMPPIVVFWDSEFYWLADGFHRYYAQQTLGLEDVEAEVREGTQRDARRYSLGANQTHGLRRTNGDKRRAVKMALSDDEWREWSDSRIASEICGCSHTFVASVRATFQLATDASSSKTPAKTRVGKDGKRRPAKKKPSSGPAFDTKKLDAAAKPNGKERVKPAQRKEALQLFGKLLRLLDKMRISADLEQPLKTILAAIKAS